MMHLDPTRVSYDLKDEAADHCDEECPCFVVYSLTDLKDEEESEYGEVEGVAEERGDVADLCI